jgi:hypothetical protein
MTTAGDEFDRLPPDARERLEAFARALERVHVDDLVLHVARRRGGEHRRVVERAALLAREAALEGPIDAARGALVEAVLRELAGAQLRVGVFGINTTLNQGPTDERVRVLRSLGDAVTALVLWERLDAADRSELLGLWDRLLP